MSGYNRPVCSVDGCESPVAGRRLCRKHYQRAWKAGEFENAPLPPRNRNRQVCPPGHKHAASSTCYIQHQCRCDPCMDDHSQRQRTRNKLKAYGRYDTGLVDAEPVREHLLMLGEFGLGYKRVSVLAGIGVTPTRNLVWGRQEPGPRYGELQKRVKRETAEALLAVKPDLANLAGGVKVPSRGVQRRVQALVARGWSQSKLADLIGMNIANFSKMMQGTRVTVARHRDVAALYEDLWDKQPPRDDWRDKIAYNRSLRFAAERRWLPPLAWDDIDNDAEPATGADDAGIDEIAVELAMSGELVRLSRDERREAVTRLCALKLSDGQIAERLHVWDRTVLRIRQELGIAASVGADGEVVAA